MQHKSYFRAKQDTSIYSAHTNELISLYQERAKANPYDPDLWHTLGRLYCVLGLFNDATRCFDKAISIDDRNETYLHDYSVALFNMGDLDAALNFADHAISLNEHSASHFALKGNILRRLGYTDDALFYFERALTFDANCLPALLGKGNTLLATNRPEDAIEIFHNAIKINHHDPESWIGISNASIALGDLEAATKANSTAAQLFATSHIEAFMSAPQNLPTAISIFDNSGVDISPEALFSRLRGKSIIHTDVHRRNSATIHMSGGLKLDINTKNAFTNIIIQSTMADEDLYTKTITLSGINPLTTISTIRTLLESIKQLHALFFLLSYSPQLLSDKLDVSEDVSTIDFGSHLNKNESLYIESITPGSINFCLWTKCKKSLNELSNICYLVTGTGRKQLHRILEAKTVKHEMEAEKEKLEVKERKLLLDMKEKEAALKYIENQHRTFDKVSSLINKNYKDNELAKAAAMHHLETIINLSPAKLSIETIIYQSVEGNGTGMPQND